jgi:hypothetical protein
MIGRGTYAPSSRRGEGWGEGERAPASDGPSSELSYAEHPHPTLSLQGEGLKAQKLLGISLEGSVG